ncbi:hypothetical protein BDW59DRAFT_119699 [Aspergillus cavernicola]|uniref:Uncharacterized protein n=1 Tax=Aspergillus cavernicola TaxID=176166 RepID=A0ABR4HYL1_9EURO
MDCTQHERLANHAAQYAAVSERVLREGHTTRPDNTIKVYARGQKRWKVLPAPSICHGDANSEGASRNGVPRCNLWMGSLSAMTSSCYILTRESSAGPPKARG